MKRPYFISRNPEIQEQKFGSLFAIKVDVENIGIHAATNFVYGIFLIDNLPTEGLKLKDKLYGDITGDIPPSLPIYLKKDIGDIRISGIPQEYVLILIKYKDVISNDLYSQELYMKWPGNPEGKDYVIYNFQRTTTGEAKKIKESFKTIINEFLDPNIQS